MMDTNKKAGEAEPAAKPQSEDLPPELEEVDIEESRAE